MSEALEQEIRALRSNFWSDRDPAGRAFVPLADAYRRAGDFDEAAELLDDGLERHPDFASAHVVAGWLAADRGDMDAARTSMERVLELDPENVVALRTLGEMHRDQGDLEAAEDYIQKLAELEPDDPEVEGLLQEIRAGTPAETAASAREEALDSVEEAPESGEDALDLTLDAEPEDVSGEGAPSEDLDIRLEGPDEEPVDQESADEKPSDGLELSLDEIPDVREDATASVEADAEEALDLAEADAEEALDLAEAASELESEDWRLEDDQEPDDDGEVYTATMAEVYVKQGLHERAAEVYERLLEADPENQDFRSRLDELRSLGADEAAEVASDVDVEGARDDDGVGEEAEISEPDAFSEPEAVPEEEAEVELEAAAGQDDTGVEAPEAEPAAGLEGSLAAYLGGLLAWSPDGLDEDLEEQDLEEQDLEEAEAEAAVEALETPREEAPLESVEPVESAEPVEDADEDAVSVDTLAPEVDEADEEAAPRIEAEDEPEVEAPAPEPDRTDAVPIASLAPDSTEGVPVESLAPDPDPELAAAEVVEEATPEVADRSDAVPVASLAPDDETGQGAADAAGAPDAGEATAEPAAAGDEDDDADISGVLGNIDALGGSDGGEDEDLDDFQKWLESMKP